MKFLWTTIHVKNLDESIAFYSSLTGLQLLQRFPAGPGKEIAMLGNGGENETLVELLADQSKSELSFGEFISIGFAVDSANELLARLKAKGIPIHGDPVETPKFKYFSVKDPNGLNVQFFQEK